MAENADRRKLAAILCADVKGYSKMMGEDESSTVGAIKECRKLFAENIHNHGGRVVNALGDSILAEFSSVVSALQCAVEIQNQLNDRNAELPDNRRMVFRIGVNLGDVIQDEDAIYGDGVNIAARIEALAEPGGVCLSGSAYDQVENKLALQYEYLGEHQVKNIKKPIRIYRVMMDFVKNLPEEYQVLSFQDKPSIAVLPFVNMSGDSEQKYFSDGITEDIITALSRSPWLFVISRNSSFTYQDRLIDIRQVSRELGVRYVLEGSVRKKGNHVRISAQLIDGSIGSHVWAEKYDSELQDIFELQDQISSQVVASILTQIQTHNIKMNNRPERPDIVTWDLLARGWKLLYELTKESLAEAETIFRKAVAFAPKSCVANYLLAAVIIHQTFMNYVTEREASISEAYKFAKRSIALDEQNEYAHWVMGVIQNHSRMHDSAIAEFKRAIELNPNCSLAHGSLGTVYIYTGEPDESVKHSEFAIRLNPRDPSIFFRYSALALAHFVAGRYLEASKWARKSTQRKPSWDTGHVVFASSLAHLNRLEEAKKAVGDYLQNIPDASISKRIPQYPFKDQKYPRLLAEGLRKAGLPE